MASDSSTPMDIAPNTPSAPPSRRHLAKQISSPTDTFLSPVSRQLRDLRARGKNKRHVPASTHEASLPSESTTEKMKGISPRLSPTTAKLWSLRARAGVSPSPHKLNNQRLAAKRLDIAFSTTDSAPDKENLPLHSPSPKETTPAKGPRKDITSDAFLSPATRHTPRQDHRSPGTGAPLSPRTLELWKAKE